MLLTWHLQRHGLGRKIGLIRCRSPLKRDSADRNRVGRWALTDRFRHAIDVTVSGRPPTRQCDDGWPNESTRLRAIECGVRPRWRNKRLKRPGGGTAASE